MRHHGARMGYITPSESLSLRSCQTAIWEGKRFSPLGVWRNEVKHAVHVPGMDAVLARRETEEGTESDDLLLQQAETEKRQTDGRNAEESEERREQAHGPSVSPERLSPTSRTPPAEAKWGRHPAPFLIDLFFED